MAHHEDMDDHYWRLVQCAEDNLLLMRSMTGQESPTALSKRQIYALEQIALELHLAREVEEAAGLAAGHRLLDA